MTLISAYIELFIRRKIREKCPWGIVRISLWPHDPTTSVSFCCWCRPVPPAPFFHFIWNL